MLSEQAGRREKIGVLFSISFDFFSLFSFSKDALINALCLQECLVLRLVFLQELLTRAALNLKYF